MEFSDALRSRHSIRAFTDQPIPREVLDRLFEAASLAPSALNEQPWRFYAATGGTRARVIEVMAASTHYLEDYLSVLGQEATENHLRWYSEFGGAPVIVACTMPRVSDNFARLNKHLSVGAAIQNLLLAATDLGIGACNITFSFWVRDELAPIFGVPDDRVIIALVVLGNPSEQPALAPPRNADVVEYRD